MKIKPFTFRILLFSAYFFIILGCKEETRAQTNNEETQAQVNGIAHFEAGVKALDANNMPQAFQEFLEAAKVGHIDSQFNVALMYEQGLGVNKNEKEALFWYENAASQGNAAAQFNLGVLYENGIGTSINYIKANEWYRKASEQGDGLAIGNLGMLYIRGQGVKENKVAGIALLLTSAAIDNSPENNARNNITATRGLTTDMVTEAQAISDEMSLTNNVLVPLDNYLNQ